LREISSMNIMNNNKAGVLLILIVLLQALEGLAGNNRIIGPGNKHFRQNSFPWLVRIQGRRRISHTNMYKISTCGGTLLNSRTVLSAAHCMFWDKKQTQSIHPQMITLYLGEHNSNKMEFGEKEVNAARYVLHPYYKKKPWDNDFAIIYMDEVIRESNIIQYACLSRLNTRYANTPVTVAGWGAIHADGGAVDIARKVDLVTVSNRDCNNIYGKITDNMICASGYGKGACQGDSGGPLMIKGRENVVIGVSSFVAIGCNMNDDHPSVFARVSSQLHWIKWMAGNICIE